jgi:hypothetical protein
LLVSVSERERLREMVVEDILACMSEINLAIDLLLWNYECLGVCEEEIEEPSPSLFKKLHDRIDALQVMILQGRYQNQDYKGGSLGSLPFRVTEDPEDEFWVCHCALEDTVKLILANYVAYIHGFVEVAREPTFWTFEELHACIDDLRACTFPSWG